MPPNQGPIADWLDLAEEEAKHRGIQFMGEPLTSKATFLAGEEQIAGKVRKSEAPNRNHSRIWHEYDDEPFMEKAHPEANVITVALDLSKPVDTFNAEEDDFIVIDDTDRPQLPGSKEKPYFYIDERGRYYYNGTRGQVYLPTNSWDAVFDMV